LDPEEDLEEIQCEAAEQAGLKELARSWLQPANDREEKRKAKEEEAWKAEKAGRAEEEEVWKVVDVRKTEEDEALRKKAKEDARRCNSQ